MYATPTDTLTESGSYDSAHPVHVHPHPGYWSGNLTGGQS